MPGETNVSVEFRENHQMIQLDHFTCLRYKCKIQSNNDSMTVTSRALVIQMLNVFGVHKFNQVLVNRTRLKMGKLIFCNIKTSSY